MTCPSFSPVDLAKSLEFAVHGQIFFALSQFTFCLLPDRLDLDTSSSNSKAITHLMYRKRLSESINGLVQMEVGFPKMKSFSTFSLAGRESAALLATGYSIRYGSATVSTYQLHTLLYNNVQHGMYHLICWLSTYVLYAHSQY